MREIRKSPFGRNGRKALDQVGGEIPPPDRMEEAKKFDFITLPDDVEGTNCSNCSHVGEVGDGKHICKHKALYGLPVTKKNCCALWDNEGALRAWEQSPQQQSQQEKEEKGYPNEDANRQPEQGIFSRPHDYRPLQELHPDQVTYASIEGSDLTGKDHIKGEPVVGEVHRTPKVKAMSAFNSATGGALVGSQPVKEKDDDKPSLLKAIRPRPTPFRRFGVKAGYTGVFVDRLGRRTCYSYGKKVPCNMDVQKQEETTPQQPPNPNFRTRAAPELPKGRDRKPEIPSVGSRTPVVYAIVFNDKGQLLVRNSDHQWGGFVWPFPRPTEGVTRTFLDKQFQKIIGLECEVFSSLHTPGKKEASYYLVLAEEDETQSHDHNWEDTAAIATRIKQSEPQWRERGIKVLKEAFKKWQGFKQKSAKKKSLTLGDVVKTKAAVRPSFTGPITDNQGHKVCYRDGKRTPCEQFGGEAQGWETQRTTEDLYDALRRLGDKLKAGDLNGTNELLSLMASAPLEELQKVKRDHHLYAPPSMKQALLQKIQTNLATLGYAVGQQPQQPQQQGQKSLNSSAPSTPSVPKAPPKQPQQTQQTPKAPSPVPKQSQTARQPQAPAVQQQPQQPQQTTQQPKQPNALQRFLGYLGGKPQQPQQPQVTPPKEVAQESPQLKISDLPQEEYEKLPSVVSADEGDEALPVEVWEGRRKLRTNEDLKKLLADIEATYQDSDIVPTAYIDAQEYARDLIRRYVGETPQEAGLTEQQLRTISTAIYKRAKRLRDQAMEEARKYREDPIEPEKSIAERIQSSKRHEEVVRGLDGIWKNYSQKMNPVNDAVMAAQENLDKVIEETKRTQSPAQGWMSTEGVDLTDPNVKAAHDKLEKAHREEAVVREEIRQATHKYIKQTLKLGTTDWKVNASEDIQQSREFSQVSFEGLQFVQSFVRAGDRGLIVGGTVKIHAISPKATKQRAFYRSGRSNEAGINIPKGVDAKTWIHEFGHHLEHANPGISRAAQEFLRYRIKDEQPISLKKRFPEGKYDEDEIGCKDNFDRYFANARSAYYTGKIYDYGATEIVSMGLQLLYDDPLAFAQADPEWFAFILGICDGSLRNPYKKRSQIVEKRAAAENRG